MITYSKSLLRVTELYFGEQPEDVRGDIIRYVQWPEPRGEARWTPFYTILVNLLSSEDELLRNMERNTRYEARRGQEKDGLAADMMLQPDEGAVEEFRRFYDPFAVSKGLPKSNHNKLFALRSASSLGLSCARARGGDPIVWHAHIVSGDRARLLYSASMYRTESDPGARQLAGRANRFLHWADMLRFKAAGIPTLDMGGWYEGTSDAERLRINSFKKGFGGSVVKTFNGEAPASLKGEVALGLLRAARRMRQ